MAEKYIVRLNENERKTLIDMVSKGKSAAYKIRNANILLKADADGPCWKDEDIALSFNVHAYTVAAVRKRFVEGGIERAIQRKKQKNPSRKPKVVGEVEETLIAMSSQDPPSGHVRWSLRLLAGKLIELNIIDSISHETVRRALKKKT